MKLRLFASLALIALMLTVVSSAAAQSYSFSLDQQTVNVYWNNDGTLALDYLFVFTNDSGGHVIDYVDVGMPNGNYVWNTISADVDGNAVSISSDFQGEGSAGFAVDMGPYAIQPGQTGRLHVFVGKITGVLYRDDDEPDTYTSGEFSPTWFGSAYVHGNTNLTVAFHLPPGVLPQEPRYHPARGGWPCSTEPETAYDDQNRITYTWACPSADGSSQYTFGASFPNQYVPAGSIVTVSSPSFNFDPFAIFAGISSNLGGFCCFGFFVLMFIAAPILGTINERKRKLKYLPPKIQIEGHGIKRGLTAVEAAILMEQPLDKVMTMILFGAVKKGAATVVSREPLKLEVAGTLPDNLQEYEKDFLAAFANGTDAARRKGLQEMTVKLVNSISDKIKGFSRKETVAYYQAIMERAWQQIEQAGTPEVKSQMYEDAMEWTMLDNEYDSRTRRVFTGPVFVPMWWGRYDPGYQGASSGGRISVPTPSSGGRVSVPGSSFAASVIGGVQGFSSRVLGDVRGFTSGVTNRTNPLPKTTSSSSGWKGGGGGGHSCACACACAGCACACAGGGR
jgi:hypothetical protein